MTEKITGIVLDCVRHNDRSNVVTLYTRRRGRMAFISAAGNGRASKLRNARLQPLSIVESHVSFRQSGQLPVLGAVSAAEVWHDIYFNPVKSAVAMFLSEFLNRFLREASPDPATWDFIAAALRNLDCRRHSAANFHLAFLVRFLDYAGITPDLSQYEKGDFLDMQAGEPVAVRPLRHSFLTPEETAFLPLLARMTLDNDHRFRFTAANRRDILGRMLRYYATHFPWVANLKSPAVLSTLF